MIKITLEKKEKGVLTLKEGCFTTHICYRDGLFIVYSWFIDKAAEFKNIKDAITFSVAEPCLNNIKIKRA